MTPKARGARCPAQGRSAGFTLIELLVVMAIVAGAMLLGIPAIQNLIVRSRTEGFAREASVLMQRTRLEAIKMNRDGVVHMDPDGGGLTAFLDADRDGTFDPDPTEPPRTTDYVLGRLPLPANVEFRDPGGNVGTDSVLGSTTVVVAGGTPRALIFQANGSIVVDPDDPPGFAFRVADVRDNFLQILVSPPATGRVQLQKWQDSDWRPAGDPASPDHKPWKWN